MMTKNRRCKTCNFCKRLCRQIGANYSLEKMYYCTAREEITLTESVCSRWERAKAEYDLSPERFAAADRDIKAIITLCGEKLCYGCVNFSQNVKK